MLTLLLKFYFKGKEEASEVERKKACAALSAAVGIGLNLFLCGAKLLTGLLCHSVAISADGFNNLADAGISLLTLLGFNIARYGRGSIHPFGHGRFEWIMGIFTSLAVMLMGVELVRASLRAIAEPQEPLFNGAVALVLLLSILIKGYMYLYNRHFAKITNSETLKATAADCISDAAATGAVLFSAAVGSLAGWWIDGYCGALVSVFIIVNGVKSLWEVLGRIMGRETDHDIEDEILRLAAEYPQILAVQNLMVHDYGFGVFVVSLRVEGLRQDGGQLHAAANEIAYELYRRFRCECFIQVDYRLPDGEQTAACRVRTEGLLRKYGGQIRVGSFRLLESGQYINVAFDLFYPAELQNQEENICRETAAALAADNPRYRAVIRTFLRSRRGFYGLAEKK